MLICTPITRVSSCLWCALPCAHILDAWLCFCVLYNPMYSTVVQCLYFKPRMSGSKRKSSGDAAGGAKKHQWGSGESGRGKDEELLDVRSRADCYSWQLGLDPVMDHARQHVVRTSESPPWRMGRGWNPNPRASVVSDSRLLSSPSHCSGLNSSVVERG